MIYTKFITTPAGVSESSPRETVIKVTKGLVYKVEFMFPSGSAGLLQAAIFDGGYQVWPSTRGEYFHTEAETISYEDIYLKEAAPFEFRVVTWNMDDSYEHGVDVRIGLASRKIFQARFLPHLSYEYMKEVISELQAEQEAEAKRQKQEVLATPIFGGKE